MSSDVQKINSLNEEDLFNFITNELYTKLNSYREMMNIPKIYKDDAAELALKDYIFLNNNTDEELNLRIADKKVVYKTSTKSFLQKQFPVKNGQLDNNVINSIYNL